MAKHVSSTLVCQINVPVRLLIFRIFPIGTDLFGMVRLLIFMVKSTIGTFFLIQKISQCLKILIAKLFWYIHLLLIKFPLHWYVYLAWYVY